VRISPLTPATWSEAQATLAGTIAGGPRASGPFRLVEADGSLTGPFGLMLLQPGVGSAVSELGSTLRYQGTLSARQREIAILAVAAERKSVYEWYAHEAVAQSIGMPQTEIDAIRSGNKAPLADDEQVILDTARALAHDDSIDDALYDKASQHLGEAALAELVMMVGYYLMLAKLMGVFQVGVPEGEPEPTW
jgi:4-carboxymuconolactone decarboxylase